MDQIKQILQQMALNLELNIAMCDKLADHDKRLGGIESRLDALAKRLDGAWNRISENTLKLSSDAYEARVAAKNLKEK